MFQNSNYALVAALYCNRNCTCLYSDIYFPIIKYSVYSVFSEKNRADGYCDCDEVFDYIKEHLRFTIPHIVIAQSVKKIAKTSNELVVKDYDNGNSFRIMSVNWVCDKDSIKTRETEFNKSLRDIETLYRKFIEREGVYDDGVTFLSLITENTEEILGYFEDDNADRVGEKYISVIRFLQYLSEHEKKLFENANLLFWSSIVVGFLRSDKPNVNEFADERKTEYYLDTAVVLGLLNLSNEKRERSAKDICDIIRSSNGILRVNPLTLEEIKSILRSVKENGPYPGTDIDSAYTRYKYDSVDIAEIENHLVERLDELGIAVFPNSMAPTSLKDIENRYRNREVTKKLAALRNSDYSEYVKGNFREVHDCYMYDFVREQRNSKGENVFFLTSNKDLVAFFKNVHQENNMITVGKAILNLWMHNSKPMDVTGCLLTEIMAHCLEIHKTKVRSKIKEVSAFFNKHRDHFDEKVYADFLKNLYRRGKNTIMAEEYVCGDKEFNEETIDIIRKAVNDDNAIYDERTAENFRLTEENKEKEDSLNKQISRNSQLQTELTYKEKKINDLVENKKDLEERNKGSEVANSNLKRKNAELLKKIKERNVLTSELSKLEKHLEQEEMKRGKAYKNRKKTFLIMLSIFSTIALFVVLFFYPDKKCVTVLTLFIPIFITLAHQAKQDEKDSKEKFYEEWDKKNPAYQETLLDIKQKKDRLTEIDIEFEKLEKEYKIE